MGSAAAERYPLAAEQRMESSNVSGWIALASFALACGLLLRARFRAESDDARSELLMDCITALVASSTLGSLPRLFGLENEVLRWGITGVSVVFGVLGWIQLVRVIRLEEGPEGEQTG